MRVSTLFRIALICSTVSGKAVFSQEIPRPDTLGANFDARVPGKATPADFDYLVGQWTFRYQRRDSTTGKYGPVLTGLWTAAKTHEDCVVEDQFSTNQGDGTHSLLMTYRVYNTVSGNWGIMGIPGRRGTPWQPGVAWALGNDRVMVQTNPETKRVSRIRYYSITRDHFLWRSDISTDEGKTWVRDALLIEATRVKP